MLKIILNNISVTHDFQMTFFITPINSEKMGKRFNSWNKLLKYIPYQNLVTLISS